MKKIFQESPMAPALIILALGAAAFLALERLRPEPQPLISTTVRYAPIPPVTRTPAADEPTRIPENSAPQPATSPPLPAAPAEPVQPAAKPIKKPRPPFVLSGNPVAPLADARTALSSVGADAEAEKVWLAAIDDPSLSPHDRKDLIEDLNETGLPDHKNLTPDDLPLIVSRLQLIENLAPNAMDDTNAAAFAEAHKDLTNMYNRLTGN